MNILVVSGFLGAGKTTFIQELARRTRRDLVVMENEYGEVGIDGPVLSQDGSGSASVSIWELTEGCVCCSTKQDFAASVLTIANTLDPEYLIVEPTGVGRLSRILEHLRSIQYERICLLRPITIIDGNSFERYYREFQDIFCDQIAAADTVLVSKMERSVQNDGCWLERKLREINPQARLIVQHYTEQNDAWFTSLLCTPYDRNAQVVEPRMQPDNLENLGVTQISIASGNELILFLQGVTAGVFGDICRAKGYLAVESEGAWLRFDVTDRSYTVTGTEPMPDARAVFIGKGLRRGLLRQALQRQLWISPLKNAQRRDAKRA